ncbi:MAG: ssl1498 family light-harvesting-like protein [Synechococcus sp.]
MYRFDENGVANNYADMPKAYVASYPTYWEQQAYLRQGAAAALLVVATLLISFSVS